MKLYNITRGQLITLWIFGIVFWVVSFFSASDTDSKSFWVFLFFLIPGALIFYTIGWRNEKKSKK